jgi:hypothetical protein
MTGRESDDRVIRFDLPAEWIASSPKPESRQIQNSALPTAPSEMSDTQHRPLTQGNDPMSRTSDVIQRNREGQMSYILSVRLPHNFIIKLDAEMEESGYRSLSETVRELLQFALDAKRREK